MKEIKLTQGKVALVDDEDYEYLDQFKWQASKGLHTYYARRNGRLYNGKRITIRMHQEIMHFPDNMLIDHIDHNGLNNQKHNLRVCTILQNQMNATGREDSNSIYKGVCWHKRIQKWRAQIHLNRRQKFLGYYKNEEDAAMAYNKKAKELFGEFAKLNII